MKNFLISISSSKTTVFYLAAIVLLAASLRLIELFMFGLWLDEGLTIILSEWPILDMIMLPTDPTPFLYYALHKTFFTPDMPAATIRLISFFAGMGSIALMYKLGSISLGKRAGLIAALLLAVSTPHIVYSGDARAYSLLFLLTLIMSYSLVLYLQSIESGSNVSKTKRWSILGIFAVANILSFYTHIVSIFWIAACNLILLPYALKSRSLVWKEILILFSGMLLLSLPGLRWIYLQTVYGDGFTWMGQVDLINFVLIQAYTFLPTGWFTSSWFPSLSDIAWKINLLLTAFTALLILATCFYYRRSLLIFAKSNQVVWLIGAYLIIPTLIWIFGYFVRPILLPRSILYCIPGFILLVTFLLLQLSPKLRALCLSVILFLWIGSSFAEIINPVRINWQQALGVLQDNAQKDDFILLNPSYTYPVVRHTVRQEINLPVIISGPSGKKLYMIEPSLGSNKNWSQDYFHHSYIVHSGRKLPTTVTTPKRSREITQQDLEEQSILEVRRCTVDNFGRYFHNLGLQAVKPDLLWEGHCLKILRYNLTYTKAIKND